MDKRQPLPIGKDEELLRKEKIDSFIESLEVKDISDIRFRDLKNVKLYKSNGDFAVEPLTEVDTIDWDVIKKCIPSVLKLVGAIKSRKIRSNDFLSTWNIYDEKGTKTNKKMR